MGSENISDISVMENINNATLKTLTRIEAKLDALLMLINEQTPVKLEEIKNETDLANLIEKHAEKLFQTIKENQRKV